METGFKQAAPGLIFPQGYSSGLTLQQTAQAIRQVKSFFEANFSNTLDLSRVMAPLFVLQGTGVNDDLNGIERPVAFPIKALGNARAEVVHSLAKWKRMMLAEYEISAGCGIYTDMNAIRPDEELDNTHSLHVDQWDWELHITKASRHLDYLKEVVRKIYGVLRATEEKVHQLYPHITPVLPEQIHFIHAEELLQLYPDLTAKEREDRITLKYGAVFLIGIGGELSDGKPHDGRAPDYDDWHTDNGEGFKGLNGDILLWNPVLEKAFEVSSMGIRVDKTALIQQLAIREQEHRMHLLFHQRLLKDELPLSIGGGIGQSRLCMFFLRKAHIGEINASIWPEEMIQECKQHNIYLL
ncbi:aspartate--ammonia ligase [Chitinophaga defluvii]|uniref:Aspartate--ammonia ligase n=1 Tax=Chitinophaga defluvii TaxID=3163343 RepID=A0ABV2T3W2_9BACT